MDTPRHGVVPASLVNKFAYVVWVIRVLVRVAEARAYMYSYERACSISWVCIRVRVLFGKTRTRRTQSKPNPPPKKNICTFQVRDKLPPSTSFFVNLIASYLPIYADVRFHIPMTHRNDAGTQAIKPRGLGLEQRLTMTLKKYCWLMVFNHVLFNWWSDSVLLY